MPEKGSDVVGVKELNGTVFKAGMVQSFSRTMLCRLTRNAKDVYCNPLLTISRALPDHSRLCWPQSFV